MVDDIFRKSGSDEPSGWTHGRILILGMTYPNYSEKYVENVCTGGLLDGTSQLVRIHPVPLRYLDPAHRFKSFQWITCRYKKHPNDPRPESLRIDPESIEPGDWIPPKNSAERRRLIEKSPSMCRSVEDLRDKWQSTSMSLGIVKPQAVFPSRVVKRSAKERAVWSEKERMLLQTTMEFERPPKPLDFPEVKFEIKWSCDDDRCGGHAMGLEQWGIHEYYRGAAGDPERDEKTIDLMNRRIAMDNRDVYFFLGNFRGTMWNFGLMDTYSCERPTNPRQGSLFGDR